jgi:hypothetical protein
LTISDSETRVGHACGLHAGDWVEVRSAEEILATLDERGCLDALPFMPEMLPFCGRQFRISGVAHKTCDSATYTGGRYMRDAVFLEDLRCDGAAHGGCQARCLFFWKTKWLMPVESSKIPARAICPVRHNDMKCSLEQLHEVAQKVTETGEVRYVCQATEHLAATEPLRPLAMWHFVEDVRTRNAKPQHVLKVIGLHLVWQLRNLGLAWRVTVWLYARTHRLLTGRPDPFREGMISKGGPTPEEKLDLKPGELVEVKSHDEILQTVDVDLRNHGLAYNTEMTPACGGKFRVAQRITRIIEEKSGRMITMKNPCITLEGVYCQGLYTHYSLLCKRRITPYFREVWLRRGATSTSSDGSEHRDA